MGHFDQYLARRYRTTTRPRRQDYLIRDNVAIVGIGMTEFRKDSGRSEHQMVCEAIKSAVDDAGLKDSGYRWNGPVYHAFCR